VRLELTCGGPNADGEVSIRLLVLNNDYEPLVVDRNLLYGPHPETGDPLLLASEPHSDEPVVLNPWCLYGRERHFQYPAGVVTFHGYLLRSRTDRLLPAGPGDPEALLAAAPRLVVSFDRS
jgi:hypothetical protein